jgi:AraC family transcriptional regulator
MKIEFKELSPIRVATLRHIGPYNQIGAKIGELCKWGGEHGAGGPDNDVMAIYYDDPQTTPPEKLRSDAALKVDGTVQAEGDVKIATIEGGLYAVGTYIGSYCGIAQAWGDFMAQLGQMGRKSRPLPCFEIYVSDPCSTPEAELITELYEPVAS